MCRDTYTHIDKEYTHINTEHIYIYAIYRMMHSTHMNVYTAKTYSSLKQTQI